MVQIADILSTVEKEVFVQAVRDLNTAAWALIVPEVEANLLGLQK